MPDIADAEPMSVDALDEYADGGRSWVAVAGHDDDTPVGYIVADVVDGDAHIEQVSVDLAWQGRGVGRALIERVREWAAAAGRPAVTLTTFREIPWNQPLYEHLGFRVIDDAVEAGPGLRAVRDHETALGLDRQRRVCMRLEI